MHPAAALRTLGMTPSRRPAAPLLPGLAVLAGLSLTPATAVADGGRVTSDVYEDVPATGGPTEVGSELREANRVPESPHRFGADTLAGWYEAKDRINERHGLSFGIHYSALYQAFDSALGEDDAASGIAQFLLSWTPVGRESGNTGTLVVKVDQRHRLGTDAAPFGAGFAAGSLLPTGTLFNDIELGVINLYWRQAFAGGKGVLVAGRVDVTDYLDVYGLMNPFTHFTNLAFSTNPTIAAPNQGFGVALGGFLNDRFYVLGGLADANGQSTVSTFDEFLDDFETFKHLELGWTPSQDRRYLDNVHVTAWHVDEREAAGTEDGWGVAASWTRFFDGRWMPFVRAGWSDSESALAQATVSAGFGRLFANQDLLGFGVNWSDPADDSLSEQYTAELFYRVQLSKNFALTPDVQYVIDPSFSAKDDDLLAFGLRLRVTF